MRACPYCSGELPEPRPEICPHCTATLAAEGPGGESAPGPAAPPPPAVEVRSSVPFEEGGDFFTRFIETFKKVLANPVEFFSGMKDGDIGLPILYAVIVQTIAGVFSFMWQTMFGGMETAMSGIDPGVFAFQTGFMIVLLVLFPLFAVVSLFIGSAIFHLGLLLLGDGQRGFAITLRAVAYGCTPMLFAIVPICGSVIGGVWAFVLAIMGAAYGHRTEGWRATVAYFLPLIFCCCLAFGMLWMFGALSMLVD